ALLLMHTSTYGRTWIAFPEASRGTRKDLLQTAGVPCGRAVPEVSPVRHQGPFAGPHATISIGRKSAKTRLAACVLLPSSVQARTRWSSRTFNVREPHSYNDDLKGR